MVFSGVSWANILLYVHTFLDSQVYVRTFESPHEHVVIRFPL